MWRLNFRSGTAEIWTLQRRLHHNCRPSQARGSKFRSHQIGLDDHADKRSQRLVPEVEAIRRPFSIAQILSQISCEIVEIRQTHAMTFP
jgi:hypothetical protein